MVDYAALTKEAKSFGFTAAGALDPQTLEFMTEVREMCAVDRCHNYNRNWACPPACGELSEIAERVKAYSAGLLVQTTANLEDEFDYEGIKAAEIEHKRNFLRWTEELKASYPRLLPMGMGKCSVCDECSYPDALCRFPEKAFPSMEAYGLMVSDVCRRNSLAYYYGPLTLTYTSCYLLD